MMSYLPTALKGAILYGLSLIHGSSMHDSRAWGAWNHAGRTTPGAEFYGPSRDSLVEQIMAAYPDRIYQERGAFLIVDPRLGWLKWLVLTLNGSVTRSPQR